MAPQTPDHVPAKFRQGWLRHMLDAALSLHCKGVLLLAVLLLTLTAGVSGYLLDTSAAVARRHQDESLSQLAAMLAKASSLHIGHDDSKALHALAEKTANGSPLLYVFMVDQYGAFLAGAEHGSLQVLEELHDEANARPESIGIPTLRPATDHVPALLDVTFPITILRANGEGPTAQVDLVGYVRTGVAANVWYRSIARRLDLLIGVGALVAVVAVPLGFLLIRRIVSPLESLTLTMLRFSQGELDIRSPVQRRDEIGRLAAAFNRMADKHQRSHERVLRLNNRLEERVAQRTQQLRELAARESLTGLYNRRHFNEVLDRRMSESIRYDGDLSVIMIDLDNFKQVNDQYGHHCGDKIILAAASTINGQLRSADVAARYGGDEFILLLPQTEGRRAEVLAERIACQFKNVVAEQFPQVSVAMSMGVACTSELPRRDADSLIRAADRALYRAKSAGKNTIATASQTAQPAAISPG